MKKRRAWKILALWLAVILLLPGCKGQGSSFGETVTPSGQTEQESSLREDGSYSSPEEVTAYLREYGRLPDNFITKKEARALGWDSSSGNLWEVTDHKSIGGDVFGNYEGLLPEKKGRIWYECDVNYSGGYRGGERIVFSSDGLIYYTNDHYQSFQEME